MVPPVHNTGKDVRKDIEHSLDFDTVKTTKAKLLRYSRDEDHGSFDAYGNSAYKVFVKRIPPPPSQRLRTSGFVGPEPDFSIRCSNLPFREISLLLGSTEKHFLKRNQPITFFPPWIPYWSAEKANSREFAEFRPKSNCYRTRDMSDRDVLQWTEFAMRNGISYSGSRDYKFSSLRCRHTKLDDNLERLLFDEKKIAGLIPANRRSEKARDRRSSLRKIKPNVKFRISLYNDIGLGSRKRNFKEYNKYTHYRSFKAYCSTLSPCAVLETCFGKFVLPDIVRSAIDNIYKNAVVSQVLKKPEYVPGLKVTIKPCKKDLEVDNKSQQKGKGRSIPESRLDRPVPYRMNGIYYNVVGGLAFARQENVELTLREYIRVKHLG